MTPAWRAVGREIDLAAAQVRSGIVALGKANHGNLGFYSQAFFGLSNGIERMAKLAIVGDYMLKHDGKFPSNGDLKRFGHNLKSALDKCATFSASYAEAPYTERPNDPIHYAVVRVLGEFASCSRYYNVNFLSGARGGDEPVATWWEDVVGPILQRHLAPSAKARIEAKADQFQQDFGPLVTVVQHEEDESEIRDVHAWVRSYEATRLAQRYGRLYVLQIVRWLAAILTGQSRKCMERGFDAFFYLHETTGLLLQNDQYFKTRKSI